MKHLIYSEVLNKYFDTEEECLSAEDAYAKEQEAKQNKELAVKQARAADVAKVQDAAKAYLALVAENKKTRAELRAKEVEAEQAYQKLLNEFADKYHGYHLTYTRNGDNVEFKIAENKKAIELEDEFAKQWVEIQKELDRSRALFNSIGW